MSPSLSLKKFISLSGTLDNCQAHMYKHMHTCTSLTLVLFPTVDDAKSWKSKFPLINASFLWQNQRCFSLIGGCNTTKTALDVKLIEFSVRQKMNLLLFDWLLFSFCFFAILVYFCLGKILYLFFLSTNAGWMKRIHWEILVLYELLSLTFRQVKRTIAFSLVFSHHETTSNLKLKQTCAPSLTISCLNLPSRWRML